MLIRIHQESFLLWYLKRFWKAFQKVFENTSDLENIIYVCGGRGLNNSEGLAGVMVSGMYLCCFHTEGESVFF